MADCHMVPRVSVRVTQAVLPTHSVKPSMPTTAGAAAHLTATEMAKRKNKRPKEEPVWIEGHKLNEQTGKLEPVRYKLKKKKL